MRKEYTTRQREQILDYLRQHAHGHTTAEELRRHLQQSGTPLSKATVYRTLERLEKQNIIRRYPLGTRQGACYQYVEDPECHQHFHLKCTQCGRLFHVECHHLEETRHHIGEHHDFAVDTGRTVFYGRCGDCQEGTR